MSIIDAELRRIIAQLPKPPPWPPWQGKDRDTEKRRARNKRRRQRRRLRSRTGLPPIYVRTIGEPIECPMVPFLWCGE